MVKRWLAVVLTWCLINPGFIVVNENQGNGYNDDWLAGQGLVMVGHG